MRLATWNVNSVRTRVDRIIAFLERENIDALAMQETKCKPEQFPLGAFAAAGYEVAVHGLNQWNGVAYTLVGSSTKLPNDLGQFPPDTACRRCTSPDFPIRCAKSRSARGSDNSPSRYRIC